MAVFLEVIDAAGNVTRLPVENGRVDIAAQPGTIYRLVDQNGAALGTGPRVLRVEEDLIITDLPGGDIIGITEFFSACTPTTPCTLSLEELGGSAGETVTPASEPVAALQEGGFLMNRSEQTGQTLVAPEAESNFNWKPIAAAGGGLLVLGAVAGGGSSGGGGDSEKPVAPSLNTTSIDGPKPVLEGQAEPNARVTVTIDVGGSGQVVRYEATSDANGAWSVDLASDQPILGELPEAGLPVTPPSPVTLVAIDSAGNTSEGATASLVIDTISPNLTIASDGGSVTNDPFTLTFTFDEAVTSFAADDIDVTGGTLGNFSGSGASYTATVTPTAGQEGNAVISVAAGAAIDSANNLSNAATSLSQAVDTLGPTLNITDNVAGTATGNVTFTFTFSEAVTGFSASDIQVSGGTAGAFTAVNASTYRLVVAPGGGASGTISITVADGVAADAAGNANTGDTTTQAYVNDLTDPVLTITDNIAGAGVADGPVTFTFTFDEPVTGFTAADVSITNGTGGALSSNTAGTVYTMVVTPDENDSGTLGVSVAAGAATDAAGNPSEADSATQAFDTDVDPTVTITSDAPTSVPANAAYEYTLTFSEPVTGLTLGDLNITGGTLSGLSGSGAVYTVTATPTNNAAGNVAFSIDANAVQDAGNNGNAATSATAVAFDREDPDPVITDNVAAAFATGPVEFTIDFGEPVSGLALGDLTVTTNSEAALEDVTLAAGSNAGEFILTVTPADADLGRIDVIVPAAATTDLAGNPSTAANRSQLYNTPTATDNDNNTAGSDPGTALIITEQDLLATDPLLFSDGEQSSTTVTDPLPDPGVAASPPGLLPAIEQNTVL